MTDIVERLRKMGGIGYEAADEIERLQEQCRGLAQSAMNNGQDLLLKEAEIERLRALLQDSDAPLPP
jgi:hypothetical protein